MNISDVVRKAYVMFPVIRIRFAQYTPPQQSPLLPPLPGPRGTLARLTVPEADWCSRVRCSAAEVPCSCVPWAAPVDTIPYTSKPLERVSMRVLVLASVLNAWGRSVFMLIITGGGNRSEGELVSPL